MSNALSNVKGAISYHLKDKETVVLDFTMDMPLLWVLFYLTSKVKTDGWPQPMP